MKRSKHLSLVLMGAMALAGCSGAETESADKTTIFKNTQECVASGQYTQEQCVKMEADAKAQTPQFATREECVKQFGESACAQQSSGGGNFWMPALLGFMAGRMLGGGSAAPAQGLYQNPSGNGFQTVKGAPVTAPKAPPAARTAPATSPAAKAAPTQRTSPFGNAVSRGGFSSGGRAIGA